RHQDLQLGIERQNLPQLGDRLCRPEATAEIPGLFHRAIAELIGAIRPPVELARGEVDGGTGHGCGERIAGLVSEMEEARVWKRIVAAHGSVVTPGHLAVAPIDLPAELDDFESPAEPAAHG